MEINKIKVPSSLPKSKELDFIIAKKKGYDELCSLLYELGSICTYDQFRRIYKKKYKDLSDSYLIKKTTKIIDEMQMLKLIGIDNLNTYKFIYLKKFALSFINDDYLKYKRLNMKVALKDKNFKSSLMKVEHYIRTEEIINLNNLATSLINITKLILAATTKKPQLGYDKRLLNKIIKDNGIKNCYEEILNLPEGNLLKTLWVDIYKIYDSLRKQNQTILLNPFHFKLYEKDNVLTLHYAPTIVIFDVFDSNYYNKKLKDLFNKYFNILSNYTRGMRKAFSEEGKMGWEGYNHFGYNIKLIGYNELELLEKKRLIDSTVNENPNGVLLSKCEIEYIDISKYFLHSSQKDTVFSNIDTVFEELLSKKIIQ